MKVLIFPIIKFRQGWYMNANGNYIFIIIRLLVEKNCLQDPHQDADYIPIQKKGLLKEVTFYIKRTIIIH